MVLTDPITIDGDERERIYGYVEAHGAVDTRQARRDLFPQDPHGDPQHERAFRHNVAILKRDGYLEEGEDDTLRIAIDLSDEREEFSADDVDVTIRPASQEDLTGIVGAIRRVVEEMTSIEAESVADALDHEDVLLRHNDVESRMFFVATVDGDVVGWAHLHVPKLEKLSHTAELTVGVLEEYRGIGIGSGLLDRALEWALENGQEKVYQSVPSTNEEAIAFFEDRGWTIEAVREDHYKLDEEYIDEVMMAISP
ncbi:MULTISPECIES: GNAT family N-acetyltransferase [Natrialba]|uniref:GNAT family N-acetyltransferase n=1 Tax=Natrialba swarupiae TaxID=2448032 RepID=A0A5D5AMG0_9EURY|nr:MULTISPECIES: GNAT family N-acetyltransferase [Natrialba]MWV40714.1 GNAT family N-acetyltransferase [Natrialba sp. INN-245]TYT62057.1 GNAT family N-acetyltransferase [Natrialba swarupiae]